ncbi:MAG: hypothetical protein A3F13_05385 [Gammaproteobacteria bacterium RIFCSPHIGHO2_12_FULL_40_19]|nr:MAG: hypothetical protein A3F13_05385 [Gammaproteobacteria bacterium RIFCSPHIGHO2_12_FULL_40_19]
MKTIAQALGWEKGPEPGHLANLCGGYFSQPPAIANVPNPPAYKTVPVTVTAKGPVIFRSSGASVLQDHVEITQPGRLIQADKAIVYHDQKTGKVTDIKLIGHVRVQEFGRLLVGEKADYDIAHNTLSFNHAIYHITGTHELLSVTTPFDAWGTAKSLHRDANGIILLKQAEYTTCSPENPSWVISAKTMALNRASGEGTARDVVIRFKKVPIFYTPYYSFPLNTTRKSGFLPPTFGYAAQDGFSISEPYYWNIAPNYDLLFTPEWYSQRGLRVNNFFRYLTPHSDGFLYATVLPDDKKFAQFKQNTLNNYADNTATNVTPYLSPLANSSDARGFFDFENHLVFNPLWSGKVYARYVTDSYFAEDFQSEYLPHSTNQIPSFAELNYQGSHWQDTFLVQTYQTLHPIDQILTPALNQYSRLPELDFNATYPDFAGNNNFNLSAQAVQFGYQSAYPPLTYQVPIGDRLHFQPSISHPFNWSSLYLTPQLTADSTSYFSELASAGPALPRPNQDINRTLPIFDIDSGMYFDRFAHIGGKNYTETLEPRLFYLYTPYLNQNNFPNFDTQLLPFSTSNLYSINQFIGFDRIQNANQLSMGLTSNLLRAADASNVLTAQLGVIDYFTRQAVCLVQNNCQPSSGATSPIAGALTWNPNRLWSVISQAAWDTALKQMNNAQFGVQYHLNQHHIIVVNYQFTHGNPDSPFDTFGFSTNTSLITAGLVWPVTMRWHFFGYSYYDITHDRPQNQYVGLSYNTCCWALRLIVSDNYNGFVSVNNGQSYSNQFTTDYYLEFLLKGLGSASNRSAEDMLTSTLPGFQDVFSNRGHYGYNQSI